MRHRGSRTNNTPFDVPSTLWFSLASTVWDEQINTAGFSCC